MTGFGSAEGKTPGGVYRVEIRGVNNRFLDIQLRQPRSFANLEAKIKQAITEAIGRGSISVFISGEGENAGNKLVWNKKNLDNYMTIFRQIQKAYKLDAAITIADLLHFSDCITLESTTPDEAGLWKNFEPVLKKAIDNFNKTRRAEAAKLLTGLKKTIKEMLGTLEKVEARAPVRAKTAKSELMQRLESLAGQGVDPVRLATEIAIMADKMDIAEECARLRAHIEAFCADFESDAPVGKRMNFLLQEMNREANTLGAKANDTEISHSSVGLKEAIEKLREQIQNIE
ncbi:MAG: YicC family protein [Chitinivibrionales bacterium]|nr:YicC family protein [Chitinivibrionales bacterium]